MSLQQEEQAAFSDLNCEVCAKAVVATTRAKTRTTILRMMQFSLGLKAKNIQLLWLRAEEAFHWLFNREKSRSG
jgi:hypothetical protein